MTTTMTPRENVLSLLRRTGYEYVPVDFFLCPSLQQVFQEKYGHADYPEAFHFPLRNLPCLQPDQPDSKRFLRYYDSLKAGTTIDDWGIAHEPGSKQAMHMTKMLHPLKDAILIDDIEDYPFPDYQGVDEDTLAANASNLHNRQLAAVANMQCTIWETAWYLRSMDELMVDMMMDDEKAACLLDRVTEIAIRKAVIYANASADILFLGDDIGMQRTIMMSEDLYCTWLKPRLKAVIDAAKAVKPDILIAYHSCGYIMPLIKHLIEAGIDILNPVQPECMSFETVYNHFGDKLSFFGTIGTQTTMPFGSEAEVRDLVIHNLDIAGPRGGLLPSPTHMLEPEVPWDNIEAYAAACRAYKPQ